MSKRDYSKQVERRQKIKRTTLVVRTLQYRLALALITGFLDNLARQA